MIKSETSPETDVATDDSGSSGSDFPSSSSIER